MKNTIKFSLFILSLSLLQACAPASYVVDAPEPSKVSYIDKNLPTSGITVNDKRKENEKVFSHGVLKAELILNGSAIEPIEF